MKDKGPSKLLSSMPKDLYTVFRRKQEKAPKLSNYRKITTTSARLITIKEQNIDISLLRIFRVILNDSP